jgi:hypothetical protein
MENIHMDLRVFSSLLLWPRNEMKPLAASNAHTELWSETRGVGYLGDQWILQQGYTGVDQKCGSRQGPEVSLFKPRQPTFGIHTRRQIS